ncbi:META domain-containing protein [Gulosibacter sp. 10]|uniref:META domain-containing protein n=1 Tax=Gulosibacter sp. 10 TaxID=1255570 RepID=UPI00097F66CC|nr:META domain-containing protein [Gulosibacter sp. 10]SJM59327.1 hypothetical protein FM112_06410 [Gulosibacter sp. 10]
MRRVRRPLSALLAAGAASLLLAACADAGSPSPIGEWGSTAPGQPHLEFSEEEVSGSDGCNGLGGPWSQDADGTLNIGPLVGTLMACPDVDTWLGEAYTAEVDGDLLRVYDREGAEIGTLERVA